MLIIYVATLCTLWHHVQGDAGQGDKWVLARSRVQEEAVQSDNNIVNFSDRIAIIIKRQCLKNANEIEYQKVLEGVYAFKNRWHLNIHMERVTAEGGFYKYCMKESEDFTLGLNEFVDKLSPCLAPQENYLKSFILSGYGDFNHYYCKYMEGILLHAQPETLKKSRNKCFENLTKNSDQLNACYKNSTVFGDDLLLDVITKPEFCEDILHFHQCYDEVFEENCPDVPKEMAELITIFVRQALRNCADELSGAARKMTNNTTMDTILQ